MKKAFENQTKTIEKNGEKQVEALKFTESPGKESPSTKRFISKWTLNPETMNKLDNIREEEQKKWQTKNPLQKVEKLRMVL